MEVENRRDGLLVLLRAGLSVRRAEDRTYDRLPEAGTGVQSVDWPSVYRLASAQGVLAIAWDGLQRLIVEGLLPADRQPDRALKLRWAYNVAQIETFFVQLRSHLMKPESLKA